MSAVEFRARSRSAPVGSRRRVACPGTWLLAGIVVVGAAIRFATLGEQSFWEDEAYTYTIVSHGLGHLFSQIPKTEQTPPLYYVLVWVWRHAFGLREVGLKSFSALCGTLTIPVMWQIGRRLISERVGLIAALLTAVNPALVWYSQEARSYALVTLLSALTLLMLMWVLERPSQRRMLGWAIVCGLALWTHYFAAFVILPEAIWMAHALRRNESLGWSQLLVGTLPLVAMSAALTPLWLTQAGHRDLSAWIASTGSLTSRAVNVPVFDVAGFGSGVFHSGLLAVCGLVLVATGVVLLRGVGKRDRATLVPFAVIGAVGVALPIVLALAGKDLVYHRNLLPTWPALATVVAGVYGASALRQTVGMLALGLLVALGIFRTVVIDTEPDQQRANWRGAIQALGPWSAPLAIVSASGAQWSLVPYRPALASYPSAGVRLAEVDVVSVDSGWNGTSPLRRIVSLPGFTVVRSARTGTYWVVRYRALSGSGAPEPVRVLTGLFPNAGYPLVLLERPTRATAGSIGRGFVAGASTPPNTATNRVAALRRAAVGLTTRRSAISTLHTAVSAPTSSRATTRDTTST